MRLTTRRRAVLGLGALALALAGCDSGRSGPSGSGVMPAQGGAPALAGESTPRQAADVFLNTLTAGATKPDLVTDDFARAITPPARLPNGEPGTVRMDLVGQWLAQFNGAQFVVGEESKVGDALVLRGRVQTPGKAEAFAMRLVKDGKRYKIDWLHRSERQGSDIKPQADPELADAQDTVRNFLDVLLGGDLRLAHALMAPAWKKALSPPGPADLRDGYDYGPGFLTVKTKAWRGDFLGYTFTKVESNSTKDAVTFTAELAAEGRKTPYTVKAVKDPATGRWFVSDFDKQ